jgi:small subunit ribosomal protein S3
MGQKTHPVGLRLGIIRDWQSKWYADKEYTKLLHEDLRIRDVIRSKYPGGGISGIEIARQASEIAVTIHTARPGIVIGRGGQQVDELRHRLEGLVGKKVQVNIQEIRQPAIDAQLVAADVAEQMARRAPYRRTIKRALFRTMDAGAKGIKICCSGRLGGAEIARTVVQRQGRVPLHTLRADIDYGFAEAKTLMGRIGVKVWVYKGDILPEPKELEIAPEAKAGAADGEAAEGSASEQPTEVEKDVTAEPSQTPEGS